MDFERIFYSTKDFEISDSILSKGIFGTTYIAENLKNSKQFMAKIIDFKQNFDGDDQKVLLSEIVKYSKLNHPSLIKFIGMNFQSIESSLKPIIITEYLPNCSLKTLISKENQNIKWNFTTKCIFLLGISKSVKYLHENGILHLDLKPENILIDENFHPILCDFGLFSCFPEMIEKVKKLIEQGQYNSPVYFAPEFLKSNKYGRFSDAFSFGLLACDILDAKKTENEEGKNGFIFNDEIPEKIQNLISQCLKENELERPLFNDIFNTLSDCILFSEKVDIDEVKKYLNLIKTNDDNDKIVNDCCEIINEQIKQTSNLNDLLHFACESGNVKLVDFLLSKDSIDINSKTNSIYLFL